MGVHLAQASRARDVITHYATWLDELPDSYRVRYELAAAYEGQGDVAGAVDVCRQALALNPKPPYLIEMLERLEARQPSILSENR